MADVPAHILSTSSSFEREGDQELLEWLKRHGADADSVERVMYRKTIQFGHQTLKIQVILYV